LGRLYAGDIRVKLTHAKHYNLKGHISWIGVDPIAFVENVPIGAWNCDFDPKKIY